jgi:ABC-type multidrug transport system fused ATPase/permease subunit
VNTKQRKIGLPQFERQATLEEPSFGSYQLMKWLWQHSKSEFVWMGLSMIGVAVGSSLSALSLLYLKRYLNTIEQGYTVPELLRIFAIIVGISLGFSLVKWLTTALGALASTNVRRNLEIACFQHLSNLPYDYLEGKSSGRLTAVLMAELPVVSNMIATILRSFIHAPLTILMVSLVLLYNSPFVALVVVLALPVLFLGLKTLSSMAKRASAHAFEGVSTMYSTMHEHLTGLRVVRCMGLTGWYARTMQTLSGEVARKSRRSVLIGALQQSAQELITLLILMLFLFWISWRVNAGTMQIGQALLVPVIILLIRNDSINHQ